MKATSQLLFIYMVILISGCRTTGKEEEFNGIISFDNDAREYVKMSEFVSSITYVPLETKPNCCINNITKIRIFGDSLLIFNEIDWNYTEIMVFNKKGKYLGIFGENGRGPEEILNPRDIRKVGRSYYIWDRDKISEFDEKGNFKRVLLKAFYPGSNFLIDTNFVYLYHATDFPGILSQFSLKGDLIRTFKPSVPKQIGSAFKEENIFDINGEFHLFAPSFDTVWAVENNQLYTKYVFNFKGDMTLQKLFLENNVSNPLEFSKIMNSTSFSYVTNYIEDEDYIFLSYSKLKKTGSKLISKKSGSQITFNYCINNIDNGIVAKPISFENNSLVILLQPLDVLNKACNAKNSEKTGFEMLRDTINEDDNSILMFCKIKKT